MARDRLRKSGLARALSDLLADLADLLRKELRLAKTEITEKITSHLRASMWMVVVGVVGMVTALLLVETAVVAVASFGIALHWSCMLVSAVLAAGAAAAFDYGRSIAEGELLPTRTVRQISRDIKIAKEQLA
jgi:Putative Actinobacterial Holin-X, holin superfamily III